MNERITFRQRLLYWFDNTMAHGTIALIGWLAVLSLVLILIFSIVLLIVAAFIPMQLPNGQEANLANDLWQTFLHAFNNGQLGSDSGVEWPFLAVMLAVTIGGIFIVSSLIGVLTNGMNARLDEVRRGRSRVLETDHMLILGWSDRVFTIVKQLAAAAAAEGRANSCIVILGPVDTVEMEEDLRVKAGSTGKTRVICRSGDPIDPDDLRIVNAQSARAILILTPENEEPDAQVIKTVLALTRTQRAGTTPYHIVAEIQDDNNVGTARLVGGTEAQFILVGDTAARLIAQTCRQSGLSMVYNQLLDFSGDSIYMIEAPSLAGKTFADALFAYESAAVIGLQHAGNKVKVNPSPDTPIAAEDKLVLICAKEAAIKPSPANARPQSVREDAPGVSPEKPPTPESFLILGWNQIGMTIIHQLNSYVPAGSKVTVVADTPGYTDIVAQHSAALRNISVDARVGNTTARPSLVNLDPHNYQHVIVLCYSDSLDAQQADARTLITLLHLRDIKARQKAVFSITSEVLDDRNRRLAEVAEVDDFIVSGKMFSLLMAQQAEDKYIAPVYADLLSPQGSEVYLKPAEEYVEPGRPVTFYDIVDTALCRGEIAIGYRRRSQAYTSEQSYGITLNPTKSQTITFEQGDRIVVLAEK
jgi:Trk K+ transport system NAD-binding subunit